MAAKPLSNEAIALTEKKMDMTLDDIIKMSKTDSTKAKNKQRVSNRSKRFVTNSVQDKNAKLRRFMDSRSTLRQGALAQRRSNFLGNQFSNFQGNKFSNFQGNQFPLASEAAKRAAAAPIRRPFSGSRANVNKPRVGAMPVQRGSANAGGFSGKQQPQQQQVKQRPQTLDSLFANMQKSRVMSQFQQNNVQQNNGPRKNGVGQRIPPWQRARFSKSY